MREYTIAQNYVGGSRSLILLQYNIVIKCNLTQTRTTSWNPCLSEFRWVPGQAIPGVACCDGLQWCCRGLRLGFVNLHRLKGFIVLLWRHNEFFFYRVAYIAFQWVADGSIVSLGLVRLGRWSQVIGGWLSPSVYLILDLQGMFVG